MLHFTVWTEFSEEFSSNPLHDNSKDYSCVFLVTLTIKSCGISICFNKFYYHLIHVDGLISAKLESSLKKKFIQYSFESINLIHKALVNIKNIEDKNNNNNKE